MHTQKSYMHALERTYPHKHILKQRNKYTKNKGPLAYFRASEAAKVN